MTMLLKPQDILVMLKLLSIGGQNWTYARLGVQLDMSPSQLHAAVKRALAAQLAVKKGGSIVPNRRSLEEFLVHGVKYVFVPELGGLTRGMPHRLWQVISLVPMCHRRCGRPRMAPCVGRHSRLCTPWRLAPHEKTPSCMNTWPCWTPSAVAVPESVTWRSGN